MELFRIVYCSRNMIDPAQADEELPVILAAAQRNNAAQGVTGALLYNDGIFAQVLEGPFEAVQTVFERIQIDPRHDYVIALVAENVTERAFAGWAMAHAKPNDPVAVGSLLTRAMAGEMGGHDAVLNLLNRVVHSRSLAAAGA